ncbi:hypothetical protein SAMN05216579_2783 [Pseudomonas granadensis]|nr:hypothetical protein SAMN05216579_2783 [Pseudomonas granadensis]
MATLLEGDSLLSAISRCVFLYVIGVMNNVFEGLRQVTYSVCIIHF